VLDLPFGVVGIDDFEHTSDKFSSEDFNSRKISGQSDELKNRIRKRTNSDFENLSSNESSGP